MTTLSTYLPTVSVVLAITIGGCQAPETGDVPNQAPEIAVEASYDLPEEALFETTIGATHWKR